MVRIRYADKIRRYIQLQNSAYTNIHACFIYFVNFPVNYWPRKLLQMRNLSALLHHILHVYAVCVSTEKLQSEQEWLCSFFIQSKQMHETALKPLEPTFSRIWPSSYLRSRSERWETRSMVGMATVALERSRLSNSVSSPSLERLVSTGCWISVTPPKVTTLL